MSQVSDNFLGLPLDEGAAVFIKESARSEGGVASMSHVLLETSKFMGSNVRHEYLMPQNTQLDFGMRAFENHVPDFKLAWDQFLIHPSPTESLAALDELLRAAGGTSAAPAMRIIPGYAILANAYKTAESITDSLYGRFNYGGFSRADRNADKLAKNRGTARMEPAPISAQTLLEASIGIDGKIIRALDSDEVDALSRIVSADDLWGRIENSLKSGGVSAADAKSILAKIGAYGATPDWAEVPVGVERSTGRITINGEVPTTLAQIETAFPDYNVTFANGKVYNLAKKVYAHNAGVTKPISVKDIVFINSLDKLYPKGVNEVEDVFVVERNLSGGSGVKSLLQLRNAVNNPDQFVFRCTFGRDISGKPIVEYLVCSKGEIASSKRHDDVNVSTDQKATANGGTWTVARAHALRMWRQHHAGLARRGETAPSQAEALIRLREAAAARSAITPSMARELWTAAEMLTDCEFEPDVNAISHIIRGQIQPVNGEFPYTVSQVGAVFAQVHDHLLRVKAHMPRFELGLGSDLDSAANAAGYTTIISGRYEPDEKHVVMMVPVLGRGVAPIKLVEADNDVTAQRLKVAVVLEEPPATVVSPIRAMIMTAALSHLVDYVNGLNTPPGFNYDRYDPDNPFGNRQARPSPRSLLLRQLDRLEQALVHKIENATVDDMPEILRVVQQVVDARRFLDSIDEIIDSLINREDWIYMLQSLIISSMVHAGGHVFNGKGQEVNSVSAGLIPTEAAKFLFGTVLKDVTSRQSYANVVRKALAYGLQAVPDVLEMQNVARAVDAEIKLMRARNGVKLLLSLVDGSNPYVTTAHASSIQQMLDVDKTADLMRALDMAINRDFLGMVNSAEFEAPWDCVDWATQFAAFSFSVASSPIQYEAVDLASEIAADGRMSSISTALARVGFEWTEIAPAPMRVRFKGESAVHLATRGGAVVAPMAGVDDESFHFYNDAPVAHQTLKITTVVPSYDIEAYGLLKAYLTLNTSRTYFAQPVGVDVADRYSLSLNLKGDKSVLMAIIGSNNPEGAAIMDSIVTSGVQFEKTPALSDVAVIMPYVSSYLTKPALTRDVAVPQCIEIDQEKSLAMTTGVTIMPSEHVNGLLSPTNGVAVVLKDKRSISTALPWVGA